MTLEDIIIKKILNKLTELSKKKVKDWIGINEVLKNLENDKNLKSEINTIISNFNKQSQKQSTTININQENEILKLKLENCKLNLNNKNKQSKDDLIQNQIDKINDEIAKNISIFKSCNICKKNYMNYMNDLIVKNNKIREKYSYENQISNFIVHILSPQDKLIMHEKELRGRIWLDFIPCNNHKEIIKKQDKLFSRLQNKNILLNKFLGVERELY